MSTLNEVVNWEEVHALMAKGHTHNEAVILFLESKGIAEGTLNERMLKYYQGRKAHPTPHAPHPQPHAPEPQLTPHIVPHATPLPEPIKIPPLAQKQQDAVDAMSKQELIAWMIEHLYFGNQVLRPYLESTDEADLRQQVRDAQEQPAPPPPLDADFG